MESARPKNTANIQLELRKFQRTDNEEYSTWYTDPEMNTLLGSAWSNSDLNESVQDSTRIVLSALHTDELVGVVSLIYTEEKHQCFAITGIAVKPGRQRQGSGTKIIAALQRSCHTRPDQEWSTTHSTKGFPEITPESIKPGDISFTFYRANIGNPTAPFQSAIYHHRWR